MINLRGAFVVVLVALAFVATGMQQRPHGQQVAAVELVR